jgi:hypothetical protein
MSYADPDAVPEAPWIAVMRAVTGPRLALLDTALERTLPATPSTQADLDWMEDNQLLQQISPGRYRARRPYEARAIWESMPPPRPRERATKIACPPTLKAGSTTTSESTPSRLVATNSPARDIICHPHQLQMF